MKRPEGFDPQRKDEASAAPSRAPQKQKAAEVAPELAKPHAVPLFGKKKQKPASAVGALPTGPAASATPVTQKPATPATPPSATKKPRGPGPAERDTAVRDATAQDAEARAEMRGAARARRKYERGEVKRFTRRLRRRRMLWLIGGGIVASLLILVTVAVYSPLLALRTIQIEGTSRINAEEVHTAVGDQLGVPLALLDFTKLTDQLSAFPLIRSYVTETVPPDTLIIHIVERQPVAAILADGQYTLLDPAGVVVQTGTERMTGVPLMDIGTNDTKSPVFRSVVEVLLALPEGIRAQVDSVSATTQDDVTLVLVGSGQRVVWGSADRSDYKARVLQEFIAAIGSSGAGEYDVSSPDSPVWRPA